MFCRKMMQKDALFCSSVAKPVEEPDFFQVKILVKPLCTNVCRHSLLFEMPRGIVVLFLHKVAAGMPLLGL